MISSTNTVRSMILHPAGQFNSDSPVREITMISVGSFALQDSGFTVGMWRAFLDKMKDKNLKMPTWEEYEGRFLTHQEGARRLFLEESHPAVHITFYEAAVCAAFCIKGGRLPTYKERAYAARAGRQGNDICGVGGDGRLRADNAHWSGPYKQNHHGNNLKTTTVAVKSFDSTPWGIYDLAGNADEWVFEGGYHGGSYFHVDPSAFLADSCFIRRDPDFHSHTIGFRIASSVALESHDGR